MAPIFGEGDDLLSQTQRLEEIPEEEGPGRASPWPQHLLQLEAGTVTLTVQPFALEFCNARERKLLLKQQEISALMCLLPEAKNEMEALLQASAGGARHSDGVKWSKPISSAKNYKINLEVACYRGFAYLALASFFKPDKMRALPEREVVESGSEIKITRFFQQLQMKKEESADAGWARTLSSFKIKTKEIDELMDFVIANML